MKKTFVLALWSAVALAFAPLIAARGQETFNYEEAQVGTYVLPALLQTPGGKMVTSARQWERSQRPALLKLFSGHVYGKMPGKAKGQHYRVVSEDPRPWAVKPSANRSPSFLPPTRPVPAWRYCCTCPRG